MRLNIFLSPNTEIVPYNYQQKLVGRFHSWLGNNPAHDELSLYSLSWLSHGKASKKGLNFDEGAYWKISSADNALLEKLVKGVFNDSKVLCGMEVREMIIQEPPDFRDSNTFFAHTPVHIKRSMEDRIKYFYHTDPESGQLLTDTLRNKLKKAGIDKDCELSFDRKYPKSRKKGIVYNGLRIKGSLCPVEIKGDPEAIKFAWSVGIGNSTGIGFGAVS